MNNKIYCIGNGSYSDWHISYAFESEEKRDRLLEVLVKSDDEYHPYNLELSDDKVDIKNIRNSYIVKISYFYKEIDIDFKMGYNYGEDFKFKILLDDFSDELFELSIPITEEEYIKQDKEKYIKIFNDYEAKIKYMIEVDGMSRNEVENLLNK